MHRVSPALRAERNLLRAVSCWAAASVGGRLWESDGLFCASSPVPIRSFNQVFVIAPLKDPDRLQQTASWYTERGRRFRVRARVDLEDSLRRAAETAGLVRLGAMPCMAFDGHLPERAPVDLRIDPVADARTLGEHVHVVAAAFGWDPEDLSRVFTPSLPAARGWAGWVGYAGGQAVAAAQLVAQDHVAGLYYVAVVDSARGKGYGEAVTRRAVAAGRARGYHLFTLQASPAGYPLYRRLGFHEVGEYVTYVSR